MILAHPRAYIGAEVLRGHIDDAQLQSVQSDGKYRVGFDNTPMVTNEQKAILATFLDKNIGFVKSLGPNGQKIKNTPSKCHMSPISSMWYTQAVQVLAAVYGNDEKYTKEEFTRLLTDLGYAFRNEKGLLKGSANDYLVPLHTFVDGYMKTSAKSKLGVKTDKCNMVAAHLNPPRDDAHSSVSLKRMVATFEEESGNSGHGRLKQAVPFVLAAQIKRMQSLIEEKNGTSFSKCLKRPRADSE